MIYLLTGMPGNGKSLRAMWMLEQEYNRNAAAVKAGKEEPRRFFSNIAGSTSEENPEAFPWLEKLPDHNDWTKLPDGSYVVYDEAHADGRTAGLERYGTLFPSTGKPGESDDPRIRAMSTHRHRGFDLLLITQWPTKLHHQLRALVGQHIHMARAMGLAAAGVLMWGRVQVDPYDEKQREKAEEEIWNYPKELYKRYKSATLHTASHKFKLPKKVKDGLITALVMGLMLFGAWKYFGWDLGVFFGNSSQPDKQAREAGAPAANTNYLKGEVGKKGEVPLMPGAGMYAALNTEPAPTLQGCVSSDRGCRCFNKEGFQIDMTQSQCTDLLTRPLPFNVSHKYQKPINQRNNDNDDARDQSPIPQQSLASGAGSQGKIGTLAVPGEFGTHAGAQ